MPYATDELSIASNRPAELYELTIAGLTYYYTSNSVAVSYAGNTYAAIPISRTSPVVSAGTDQPEIAVTFHESASFLMNIGFGIPPQGMSMVVRRYQQVSAEAIIIWLGKITAMRVTGRAVEVRSPSVLDAALASQIPSAYLQRLCNHVLYDDGCLVTRATFQFDATVVSQVGRTLVVNAVGGGTLKSGEARIGTEFRTVIAQTGTTLTLLTGFRSVTVGQAISLFQGCDHTVTTCRDTFANVDRFGGFPYLDWKNPFESGHLWEV